MHYACSIHGRNSIWYSSILLMGWKPAALRSLGPPARFRRQASSLWSRARKMPSWRHARVSSSGSLAATVERESRSIERKAGDRMKTALYPGTFDPVTKGHVDLVERGRRLFDQIVVAVADNPAKEPLFPLAERVRLFEESVAHV